MPKKKSQPDGEGNAEHDTMPMSWAPGPGAKKATSSSATPTSAAPSTALIICRNKYAQCHCPRSVLRVRSSESMCYVAENRRAQLCGLCWIFVHRLQNNRLTI